MRFLIFLLLTTLLSCTSTYQDIVDHRKNYKQEFLHDPRSPLDSADLTYLDFYPPSSRASVEGKFTITPDAEPFEMPTYSGVTRTYRKWGEFYFRWKGKEAKLSVYQNLAFLSNPVYADYLFLPFKDETNGITTYGGGRYLNVSKADTEDGLLVIDFNKSYNPWCAYSDGFNCPIPPVENHLSFPVHAGEKSWKGIVKHK